MVPGKVFCYRVRALELLQRLLIVFLAKHSTLCQQILAARQGLPVFRAGIVVNVCTVRFAIEHQTHRHFQRGLACKC